jgi:hypothetical protein
VSASLKEQLESSSMEQLRVLLSDFDPDTSSQQEREQIRAEDINVRAIKKRSSCTWRRSSGKLVFRFQCFKRSHEDGFEMDSAFIGLGCLSYLKYISF